MTKKILNDYAGHTNQTLARKSFSSAYNLKGLFLKNTLYRLIFRVRVSVGDITRDRDYLARFLFNNHSRFKKHKIQFRSFY